MLSWTRLREQFGEGYGNPKDFKQEFKDVLRRVLVVYAAVHIYDVAAASCYSARHRRSAKVRAPRLRTTQRVSEVIHDESPTAAPGITSYCWRQTRMY